MQKMDFAEALDEIRSGFKVSREGWNGKGMYVALHVPDNPGALLPFLYLKTADHMMVPWTPSQTDILAVDWVRYSVAEPSKAQET